MLGQGLDYRLLWYYAAPASQQTASQWSASLEVILADEWSSRQVAAVLRPEGLTLVVRGQHRVGTPQATGRSLAVFVHGFLGRPLLTWRHFPELIWNDQRLLSWDIGLYAYRKNFLLAFARLAPTKLEYTEGLEQLRALEHGYRILVVPTTHHVGVSVDTPADLEKAEAYLAQEGGG